VKDGASKILNVWPKSLKRFLILLH